MSKLCKLDCAYVANTNGGTSEDAYPIWTYLSPRLLTRIIDEVDGVMGVKQSAGDMQLLADLLIMAGNRARIMTAVDGGACWSSGFSLFSQPQGGTPTSAYPPSKTWSGARRADEMTSD